MGYFFHFSSFLDENKGACDLSLVMIPLLASKWQVLKVGMPVFSHFMM
jgi:hypothetical protein